MAPRKRKAEEEAEIINKPDTTATRVTRSSTRRAIDNSSKSQPPKKKEKEKEKVKVKLQDSTTKEKEGEETVIDGPQKTIVIEHCKQCNSFKTRATQVKSGLENAFPGITVLVNPDMPRRGCFEIRGEGGEKFISLLDMKRPFQPMKALDMDKVVSDIIDKIK